MRSIIIAICVVLCLAVSSAFAQTGKKAITKTGLSTRAACQDNGMTQAEIADLLAAHNKARGEVKVSPVAWDCTIANNAAAWVKKNVAGHSDTMYGENVFVSSDDDDKVTKATDRWRDEREHWHNKTATCDPGKTCTHYTQLVWRSTKRIGCAVNRHATGKWKLILVCNYDVEATGGKAFLE